MPYDPSDARSQLPSAGATSGTAGAATAIAAADYLRFYELPPAVTDGDTRTWYGRTQHLVIGYTDLAGETTFEAPTEHPDECALLLPDSTTSATITIGTETTEVAGGTLTFVPPGPATMVVSGTGRVVTICTARAAGSSISPVNAESYREPHPGVAPLVSWPDPVGGFRLRTYDVNVPGLSQPPFRIFRCSSFMVNYTHPRVGPRDTTKMSPHVHDDFEQCSLIIDGEYVHHLRWPWTTDLSQWRDDDHERTGSPSVTVIPPGSVHTSQAIAEGSNHLIDIFSPPRLDFSQMDGWVLNAADYPMPGEA